VIKNLDNVSLFGPTGNRGGQGRLQDQFGLLERIQLPKVAQELQEPDVPWQVALADTTKDPQVGFE